MAFGVTLEFQGLVPAACLTLKKDIVVSLFAAAGYTGFLLAVAKCWVFPTPFTFVIGIPAWMLLFFVGMAFAMGLDQLKKKNPEFRTQFQRFAKKLYLESDFLLIYPLYSAMFLTLSSHHQTAFVFVLPLIKMLLKKRMATVAGDIDDLIPCMVVSVNIFNALYQSKCMQNSGSMWTTAGIILIDTLQNLYSLRRLSKQVREVQALTGQSIGAKALLAYMLEQIDKPDQRDPEQPKSSQAARRTSVPDMSSESAEQSRLDTQNAIVIRKFLQLLWACELLLLVEYIETKIPFMYAAYLVTLAQLPNAKYYPGMEQFSSARLTSVAMSIVVYGCLELFSLFCVHLTLKRRFKFSALHQLACIFEGEWLILQGTVMGWVVILLQFTVVHYGKSICFFIVKLA
uniref:Uncharacterized protein n=1 Tax=Globisporangium ultimum (strain ATCC 200006 / CBS 805.95 / DAOM BR144) TaxID=431595 RepID=K3WWQ9_GLOUD